MNDVLVDPGIKFFSSGSTLLDLALGGGWALPRIFNIVGDKSTGKTLLAIEGFANFKRTFPVVRMRYAEAEAAFDNAYGEILGMPLEVTRPKRGKLDTVQDFQEDLKEFVSEGLEVKTPGLYVLDSLDALSDDAELKEFMRDKKEGEEAKGSFGVGKPKEMSKLFRILTQTIETSNTALGIISQIRDNIGVMYGDRYTRSGGHALDFYCSQVLWLKDHGKITRTYLGEVRPIGVEIEGYVKKLKVGFPFRSASFNIMFGYGVDDEMSVIDWLKERGQIKKDAHDIYKTRINAARDKQNYAELKVIQTELKADAQRVWAKIEEELKPVVRKYV